MDLIQHFRDAMAPLTGAIQISRDVFEPEIVTRLRRRDRTGQRDAPRLEEVEWKLRETTGSLIALLQSWQLAAKSHNPTPIDQVKRLGAAVRSPFFGEAASLLTKELRSKLFINLHNVFYTFGARVLPMDRSQDFNELACACISVWEHMARDGDSNFQKNLEILLALADVCRAHLLLSTLEIDGGTLEEAHRHRDLAVEFADKIKSDDRWGELQLCLQCEKGTGQLVGCRMNPKIVLNNDCFKQARQVARTMRRVVFVLLLLF
ncbi:MAG: hypothetical protein MHM6MM_009010 [Cercozoa sp. M6MM]